MSRWLGPPDIQSTMQLRLVLRICCARLERVEELNRRETERGGCEVPQPVTPTHLAKWELCVGHEIDSPCSQKGLIEGRPRRVAGNNSAIRLAGQWFRMNSLELSRAQKRSWRTWRLSGNASRY